MIYFDRKIANANLKEKNFSTDNNFRVTKGRLGVNKRRSL